VLQLFLLVDAERVSSSVSREFALLTVDSEGDLSETGDADASANASHLEAAGHQNAAALYEVDVDGAKTHSVSDHDVHDGGIVSGSSVAVDADRQDVVYNSTGADAAVKEDSNYEMADARQAVGHEREVATDLEQGAGFVGAQVSQPVQDVHNGPIPWIYEITVQVSITQGLGTLVLNQIKAVNAPAKIAEELDGFCVGVPKFGHRWFNGWLSNDLRLTFTVTVDRKGLIASKTGGSGYGVTRTVGMLAGAFTAVDQLLKNGVEEQFIKAQVTGVIRFKKCEVTTLQRGDEN